MLPALHTKKWARRLGIPVYPVLCYSSYSTLIFRSYSPQIYSTFHLLADGTGNIVTSSKCPSFGPRSSKEAELNTKTVSTLTSVYAAGKYKIRA